MQYDSLFSVSKAIAQKMGADSTKKYDSTYSVMLEILNRIGSTGGGDASKLESVDVFPTEGVKDGDVVYLKGNAEKADGFYVATLNDEGAATWILISGGGSSVKTYNFQTLSDNGTAGVSETDRVAILRDVKNGEMIRINVLNSGYSFLAIGTYYTDTRAEVNFGFAVRSNQYYKYDTSTDIVQFIGVDDMKKDIDGLNKQVSNLITRTQEINDNMGAIKAETLPSADSVGDELYVKRDSDGYDKIYSKYTVQDQTVTPPALNASYKKIIIKLSDDVWTNYYDSGGNYVALLVSVPAIEFNNIGNINIMSKADNNGNRYLEPIVREDYTKYFSIVKKSDNHYEYHNVETDDVLVGYITIDIENHSFVLEAVAEYYFMLQGDNQKLNIDGTETSLDLAISTGYTFLGSVTLIQATPHIDADGNIIEQGKKLSEKYNPYHTTNENSNYKFPRWNKYGQITGGFSVYNNYDTLNGENYRRIALGQNKTFKWFAPTTGGTAGQVLQSNGNAAPIWTDLIKIQKITQDAYDALETKDDNVLYVITD